MAAIFGVDFGTTNSLVSLVLDDQLIDFTNPSDDLPHPSVVWYHGESTIVGRNARQHLDTAATGIIGDVVRSPKLFLGSGQSISVAGVSRHPGDVVAEIFRFLRDDVASRGYANTTLDRAVLTIPVSMDGRARRTLRDAALNAGIHIVQFVHEPLAALYGHLRMDKDFRRRIAELENQLVLVFDWGGGTLDLTLCRFVKGNLLQVQSKGNNTLGGDRFDERVLRHAKQEHERQHGLKSWPGAMPGGEAKLLSQCEQVKILLSSRQEATLLVPNYLHSAGKSRDLDLTLTRDSLVELTKDLVHDGIAEIDRLLEAAGVRESAIALCLATGGVVRTPYVRERLLERFGIARLPDVSQSERAIAQGAAWLAHDKRYLRLAKPFEVLHADNSYVPIIHERTQLPLEGDTQHYQLSMYCVDPRDGHAKLQFARPTVPGRTSPSDARSTYAAMTLAVDSAAEPMFERIEIQVQIDHNLVATIDARSMCEHQNLEIYDLEFGLGLEDEPSAAVGAGGTEWRSDVHSGRRHSNLGETPPGAVRLRSNITSRARDWHLVPGEIVERYRAGYMDVRNRPPEYQVKERLYYVPCALCGRTLGCSCRAEP